MLARSRSPNAGVNVVDIALVLLQPDNGRRFAEPYYRRPDRAGGAGIQTETGRPSKRKARSAAGFGCGVLDQKS